MSTNARRITVRTVQEALSAPANTDCIYGVKVVGSKSSNGRLYPADVIKAAVPLYEGAKVNLNHLPASPTAHRHIQDRFGKLINVRWEQDTLRADLLYNPAHPLAESVLWWARNQPDCIGLSHDAIAAGKTVNSEFIVDKIISVKSVDLVANPATAKSLFESADMADDVKLVEDDMGGEGKDYKDHLGEMVKAIMCDETMSREEKRSKILTALKLHDDVDPDGKDDKKDEKDKKDGEDYAADDMKKQQVKPGEKALREELDALKAQLAAQGRKAMVERLCAEAKLPGYLLTDVFAEQLMEAADDATVKKLIEDRRKVAGIQKPRSSGPVGSAAAGGRMTQDQFERTLRGR